MKFEFKSLRSKLLVFFLALGLIPLVAIGYLAYSNSRDAILVRTGETLSIQAADVADKIDRNLFERYGDVQAFAFNPMARGDRMEITAAANFYMQAYGIYDLMVVVDRSGEVLGANTVNHEGKPIDTTALVGRSLAGNPWFDHVAAGKLKKGETFYSDLEANKLVAEIYQNRGLTLPFSAPIVDENGSITRIWINFASRERVVGQIVEDSRQVLRNAGFTSAELQVLHKGGQLIDDTDSKVILSPFNLVQAELDAAKQAVSGKLGYTLENHKRRKVVQINGYATSKGALGFPGYGWGTLVRQDADEAYAAAYRLRNLIGGQTLVCAMLIILIASWVAKSISEPLIRTEQVLGTLAAGDLTGRIHHSGKDEIGRMGEALNSALDKIGITIRAIGDNSQTLSSSSEELTSVSEQMSANAEETSAQAGVVSAAAEEVNRNIQTVATASEEMSASIREIAKNASEAARVASNAVQVADSTNATVAKLGENSAEIGEVIKVINTIAEQTNLLALNATIEAARAGEAGKGFAVVANEVKELAKQTGKATQDISQKIQSIQGSTKEAVEAIGEIGGIINQINDISNTIASAVEEQSATTNEISRSVAEAAKGASEITQNVTGVAEAARSTASGASDTQTAAGELSRMAAALQALVGQFKYAPAQRRVEPVSSIRGRQSLNAASRSQSGHANGESSTQYHEL